MSIYNPRGGYENRSLLKEAIANRLVREFELESLYKGPETAAIEVMHKYDGTRNEMAWVLMGDSITKSAEVYAFIDNVIKAAGQEGLEGVPGHRTGPPNAQGNPTLSHMQPDLDLPGAEAAGLGGGASQGTAGGNQQSHAPKQGLGARFKDWAKNSAAPAMGRGLRHLGAGALAGAATLNPLAALGAAGASMYQAHKGKQSGQYNKVMGGEGGLNQLAGDAAKQGAVGVKNAANQQAQNFQTGQGAAGKVGQAAGAAGSIAGGAWQGMKNLAGKAAGGVQNAWNQAGQQQQQNLAQADPNQARINARLTPPPGGAGGATGGEVAQANPQQGQAAVNQILQEQGAQQPQQGLPPLGGNAGMFGAGGSQTNQANESMQQVQTSNDTYSSIESILKGW
jgi:hypothetical protein